MDAGIRLSPDELQGSVSMFQLGRKTSILLFVYLMGVGGYIYYLYGETQAIINNNINDKLLNAALGGAAILGDRYHDNLHDRESKSPEQDWEAIQRLTGFNKAIGLSFIYTVIERGGALYLASSSASDEELKAGTYVRFFDPYPDASQALRDSFGSSEPSWIDYSDRWGDFRAVFVPQRSHEGTVYIAGAEIALGNFQAQLREDSLKHIGLGVLVLLAFSLWFAVYLLRVRGNFQQLQANEQVLKQARDLAEKADREKTKFLASMSHEIRTPLYGVIGASELLLGSDLDAEENALLNTIQASGQALLSLIDDILDLAKVEAGKLQLRPRVFDVRALVASTAEMVRQNIQNKPLVLKVEVTQVVPLLAKADAERIRQILLNLLGNAVKFTDTGEVTVSVSTCERGIRDRLTFTVRDTGIGIPIERQSHLFKPFTQLGDVAGRPQRGTGLGLSICQGLVQALGGRLTFASEVGVGSVFSFSVATETFEPSEIPQATSREVVDHNPSFATLWPLDILLVEDNPVNRKIAQAMLQRLGYQPRLVADGLAAVEASRASTPDVILMDINMPNIDGLEATRRIRRLLQGAPCYIVAFTAGAFLNELESCMAAGANDVLIKPARLPTLAEVLQRAARYRQSLEISVT